MKKLLKKIALTLTLLVSISTVPTFAAVNNNEKIYYENSITTDKFIDPNLIGTTEPNAITPFNNYGESQVTKNLETNKTVYVAPTGQPGLGYEGGSGAQVFFFETGGNSVKFTVKIDLKNVTLTAETGKTRSSGSGYSARVPSSSGKHKFEFIKYYKIKTKKIDVYKYGVYQYTYYVHDPQYSLSHRWVKL